MGFENCPDWICNQQGIPHDYVYLVTCIVVALPYLLLLRFLYKKKKATASKKQVYFFILSIPLGYLLYNALLFFLFLDSKNTLLNFIGITSYAPLMMIIITIPFSIIGMIILFFKDFSTEGN